MRKTSLLLTAAITASLIAGAALAQPPQPTPEERAAAFKAADKNADGKLDKTEFTTTLPEQFKQYADQAFTGRDTDKDGFISQAEFSAPMARRGGQ